MTGRVQTLRSTVAGNRPTGRQPGELYVNWADNQFGVINASSAAQDLLAIPFFSTLSSYVVGSFVVYNGQLYRALAPSSPGAFVPANWAISGGAVSVGDAPPTTPQSGTLWFDSAGGQLYVWYVDANSSQWVVVVSGGPSGSTSLPLMNGTAAIGNGAMWARNDHVHPTDTTLYPMSNPAGYQTAAQVTTSLGAYLPLAGGTLTGNLVGVAATFNSTLAVRQAINLTASANTAFVMQKGASGNDNEILGYTGAGLRWLVQMGDTAAESGGNAGSNFAVNRYTDASAWLDAPLMIYRSTGATQFGLNGIGCGRNDGGVGGQIGVASMGFHPSIGMTIETASGNVCMINNRIAAAGGIQSFRHNSGISGNISVNGATATFNSGSDVRLKRDEHNDFDAGPILDAIQVYDFAWTTTDERAYGVMAQECNDVFPDAVHYDEEEDWWGVDYSKFVPLLLQEIKALRLRVAALEAGQ